MADYLYLFKGGVPSDSDLTPEEMQQHMQKWFTWIAAFREKGIYKGGEPLEKEGNTIEPDRTITDGPFTESKELIGGFVMIEAGSLEEASELAKDCPVLDLGGRVEVRRVMVLEAACAT